MRFELTRVSTPDLKAGALDQLGHQCIQLANLYKYKAHNIFTQSFPFLFDVFVYLGAYLCASAICKVGMNDTGSQRIQWINQVIDPKRIGATKKDESHVYQILDRLFEALPVELTPLLDCFEQDPNLFLGGRTIDRILMSIINEEDNRIANFDSKRSALILLARFTTWARSGRIRLRRALQNAPRWCDEIDVEEGLTMDWVCALCSLFTYFPFALPVFFHFFMLEYRMISYSANCVH